MATLLDSSSREILSDAPGPQRAPGTLAIGRWLVHVSATLWRLADLVAGMSSRRRMRRPLDEHPDPDVRLLAGLARAVGDAATRLSPPEDGVDDPELDIPF